MAYRSISSYFARYGRSWIARATANNSFTIEARLIPLSCSAPLLFSSLPCLKPMSSPLATSFQSLTSLSTATKEKPKKSPHSKLLRCLSPFNTNAHFACVEAEFLRLNWNKAMDKCVSDWIQKERWDDLIELEDNVSQYVEKNLTFLEMDWKKDESDSIALCDRMRMHYFPYEKIISSMVRDAIKRNDSTGDEETNDLEELQKRMAVLSKASKLLDAMTAFKVEQTSNDEWSMHHATCSNCYRLAVSGWFLLWRRKRDAILKTIKEPGSLKNITKANNSTIHPEELTYLSTKKWIEFCQKSHDASDAMAKERQLEDNLPKRIAPSDKPLITGIVKMLSSSENEHQKKQSALLNIQLKRLFPE